MAQINSGSRGREFSAAKDDLPAGNPAGVARY
ncbi:hypothetical protein COLO4_18619 [Corchorus olitorius]|uniref:Uncharacterized protein n=1 Tax=Corchorus olitorius TaxID=93759 RepID=A0A1R3J8G4_9ROSI|nr:hypothetical protein COLO4_18619 [Corchorus olitorius]